MSHGWVYLLIFVGLTCPGCGHLPQLAGRARPAVSAEVQTVAILPFQGELGDRVAEEVASQFTSTGAYSIVEPGILSPTDASTYAASDRLNEVLAAARQRDIDAVLTGVIIESTAPKRSSWLHRAGLKGEDRRTLIVEYCLVDTRTGETLSKNTVRSLEPVADTSSDATSSAEVEDSLIAQCSHEMVSRLSPKRCAVQALAKCMWSDRGVISVNKGNRCATSGNWSDAVDSWKAAVEANPQNDAALFNLALAAASQHEYDKAEQYAMRALRARHSDDYERGLENIRKQRAEFEERRTVSHP